MKAYVIVKGSGEYSERCEKPVKVYLDKDKVQTVMVQLEALRSRYLVFNDWWRSAGAKYPYDIKEESSQAYATMGFDAWFEHDWELCEVDLEP